MTPPFLLGPYQFRRIADGQIWIQNLDTGEGMACPESTLVQHLHTFWNVGF